MREVRLIVITGLPGTGKSSLARQLARRYRMSLLAKDTIKEPLVRIVHGLCAPPAGIASRQLSDAAFSLLFALAAEQLMHATDLILEGNFRAPEHEPALRHALPRSGVRVAQVLCRSAEPGRLARLMSRHSQSRHPVHRLEDEMQRAAPCDRFLELPGERLVYENGDEWRERAEALLVWLDRFHADARAELPT
ncbi:MAG TPA: AAA family ATPase [Steroidobacteraceae bacterium]